MKKGLGFLSLTVFLGLSVCCWQVSSFAGSVTYLYDHAGRLTKAKYDTGKVIEDTYDNAGNLLEEKVLESVSVCTVESLALSPAKLKLKKDESQEITITVTGEDGCPVEGEIITVRLNASAKKLISVSPAEQATGANGDATFTISAGNKAGNATVTFQCSGKTRAFSVKIGK